MPHRLPRCADVDAESPPASGQGQVGTGARHTSPQGWRRALPTHTSRSDGENAGDDRNVNPGAGVVVSLP